MQQNDLALIPEPESVVLSGGSLELKAPLSIAFTGPDTDGPQPVALLAQWLKAATKEDVEITGDETSPIQLIIDVERDDLGKEGYELIIDERRILLLAYRHKGLLYGVMTLRQLFPVQFEIADGSQPLPVYLPKLKIEDRPRYGWRGLSLDCCRHFVDKEYILRLLDLLAYHKMNVFHWHLTEDQGWRLAIARYPKLEEIAAYRGKSRYGGIYTKEVVQEVLAHANKLGILVVPEIEMPGHSTAALAAYPELSCTGGPFEVSEEWGIHKETYCAGKEKTFEFLTGLLDEVLELFPSPYIHCGGDEAPKDRWEKCPDCQQRMKDEGLSDERQLQSWFLHRIATYLRQHGRQMIGWDEIAEGGVPEGAILQHWNFGDHLDSALEKGHRIISSSTNFAYMDFPYYRLADGTTDPPGKRDWMKTLTPEWCYQYELLDAERLERYGDQVLGGEAAMWLEFAPQPEIDKQLWPRLCGLAEAFWTPREKADVQGFSTRLWDHLDRLGEMGVDFYPRIVHDKRSTREE